MGEGNKGYTVDVDFPTFYLLPSHLGMYTLPQSSLTFFSHTMHIFPFPDSQDGAWYLREKLKQAEKKLLGYNPAYVMRY